MNFYIKNREPALELLHESAAQVCDTGMRECNTGTGIAKQGGTADAFGPVGDWRLFLFYRKDLVHFVLFSLFNKKGD